jgi:hypothetical protein
LGLVRAAQLLSWVSEESKRRQVSVAADYQNPGKPELRAFAATLLESWIFLTGKKLGHKSTALKDFVAECWGDLSAVGFDWEHSIRQAEADFDNFILRDLMTNGPSWK